MSGANVERMTDVLVEHSLHDTFFAGIGGRWSVECKCGMTLVDEDLTVAERRFAAHQAASIARCAA